MQQLLKQSTAATTIVGPIMDSTGAVYTGAVIGDLNITKNGTTAAMAAAATLTHDHNGHYLLVLTTGNTDTLGRLDITCNKSTYAMPPRVFEVLAAATFDTLVTNGTLASMTSGRTAVVDSAGIIDANTVKVGPTGSGVAQTGGDVYATVTNIAVTSAALNSVSSTAVVTTGTETNTYTSTAALDGTYHSVADVTGTTDFYYEFDVSATTGGTGTGITWTGYLAGVANTMKVYAYNWGSTTWQQIGTVTGIAGTNLMQDEWEITNSHTGTGANLGKVRIRFSNTGLTASSLKTDRILLGYAVVLTPPTNWSSQSIDASGRVDLGKWIGVAPLALSSQQVQSIVPDTQKVDVNTIKTQALTAAAGITFGVYVGGTGAAALAANLTGDPYVYLGTNMGALGANLTAADDAVMTLLNTVAGYVDTEVAAIKAKTDNLPSDPADASDIAALFNTVNSTLATIAGYIDTEVAAIKAKTDNLPAAPAAVGDIPTAIQNGAATLAAAVEGAETLAELLRIVRAATAGKSSGFPSGPAKFRDKADSKDRITATFNSDGNRLTVTTDGT